MATESLATDQTAEGHVQVVKLTHEIKDVPEESSPEAKNLEGMEEELIKVEDSAAEVVSATKSKGAIVYEEKEDNKIEPQAEEVKIGCPVSKNQEGRYEETIKAEVSKVGDTPKTESEAAIVYEEKPEVKKSEPVAEEVKKEEVEDETSKREADSSTADSKEEADFSAAVEPAVEAATPDPLKQSLEASAEDLEATLVQVSESEAAKEPAVIEAAAEQANTTEEFPLISLEPVTEIKETEPLIVLKEEPRVADSSKVEKVSDVVTETAVKELKEEGEGAVVTEEVPYVPKLENVDLSDPIAINPVSGSIEGLVKLEDKVEEEKAPVAEEPTVTATTNADVEGEEDECLEGNVVAEEPTATATIKADVEEKKDESLEGKNTKLIETPIDIDVQGGKNSVHTEADNLESEKTEKDDEKTPVQTAKDIGDAPKIEVRSKSSHRQSNSLFSKVKQSIVKVKKAIIGKPQSSKTISSDAKGDVKVK